MVKYGDDEPPRREHRSKRKDRKKDERKANLPEENTLLRPPRLPADGEANTEPSAATSSPLLVRPDGDPGIGRGSSSPNRKPKRKPRLLSAASALGASRSRSQRQDSDATVRSQTNEQPAGNEQQHDRSQQARKMQPWLCGTSEMWKLLIHAVCVRGSLRSPLSSTELPPLSANARAQIQSLDAVTSNSHINVSILHTDNTPLASSGSDNRSRGRPVAVIHLVDSCSGRPIENMHRTSQAAISTRLLDQLEWNTSHTWSGTQLKQFLSPEVLVLVEIVQPRRQKKESTQPRTISRQGKKPLRDTQATKDNREEDLNDPAQHKRLAWCFFKPVSDSGNIRLASINLADVQPYKDTNQRLQLYAWQHLGWLDMNQARNEYRWDPANPNGVPAVFLQYQKRMRGTLPCSLHVKIRPVASASTVLTPRRLSGIKEQASDRSLVEEGAASGDNQAPPVDNNQEINQEQGFHHEPVVKETESGDSSIHDPLLTCKRQIGEPCLVPQRVLHRLPTGRRGCSCLAFSPEGLFLAVAVHHVSTTAEEWVIHIYQVNTGLLWQTCRGHRSIIYSLEWGLLGDGTSKGLVSASSDGSALLWLLRESVQRETTTQGAIVVLPHQIFQHFPAPVFVYCAIFHATEPQLVITGSSDGLLRLWDVNLHPLTPPSLASAHSSTPKAQWKVSGDDGVAIHSIRMETKATRRLFCGDSHGNITVWTPTTDPTGAMTSFQLAKTVRTGQRSVASLHLHPRKQHLLVLTHPHALLQYELRSFLLLHKNYTGVECDELLVQAAFSPDGQFVVSGSEDGVPHLFHSVSGQRLDAARGVWGQRFFHGFPLMEIAWSPSAHIVAMAAYGENHPVVVLCAHQDDLISGLPGFRTAIPDGQGSTSGDIQRSHRSSSDVKTLDPDARPSARAPAAADTASGKHSNHQNQSRMLEADAVASDRMQRALQRRQQRLEATLAREIAESQTQQPRASNDRSQQR